MKKWYVILVVSVLVNILVMSYILKREVRILFNDYLVYYYPKRAEVDYDKIDREINWVSDEAMAVRLVEAYLGNWLNYSKESDPLFTTTVSFDEEKYEYLVQITIKQRAGVYAGTEERFLVGIRKDYGIITFYDQ